MNLKQGNKTLTSHVMLFGNQLKAHKSSLRNELIVDNVSYGGIIVNVT